MTHTEQIRDEHSSFLLQKIDAAVSWSRDERTPVSDGIFFGQFDMEDLAQSIGLATDHSMDQFLFSLTNRERMGPSGIWKKVARNEISVRFGRGFSLDSVVLHFPFASAWFPSVVYPEGRVSAALRCHEDEARIGHWTARGQYTPDLMNNKNYPHGLGMIYDWDRIKQSLHLVAIQRHELTKRTPESPVRVVPTAERIRIHLSFIGDFSVPGMLSELEFFQNLIFPFRPFQMDIQRQVFRTDTMDDFFGVHYMPNRPIV